MMNEYQPRREQKETLAKAMEEIRSVPYTVTARWLFYRLLQEGLYQKKGDYHNRFLPLIAKARKRFFEEWRPDTLADDTRELVPGGSGFNNIAQWLQAIGRSVHYNKAKWLGQDYYIEIWFEAAAMLGQFRHYTEAIPLLAFHGDVSIPEKWETAKRLENVYAEYSLPIVILYFGDDDPKGWEIPESALTDIRAWCAVDLRFIRVGLNEGDGERLGIPSNPEDPGHYQWEALGDEQAGRMISDAVSDVYNQAAYAETLIEQDTVTEKFQKKFKRFIKNW